MPSLALRLVAPLQAWGATEEGENRRVNSFPTRSGVMGMLSNAAGLSRKDSVSPWESLRMGVRVDKPGTVIRDYHTAHGKQTSVTQRYYLSDAAFLVVLSGDESVVSKAHAALSSPSRSLFFGRKSCPPSSPLLGENSIYESDMREVLRTHPWVPFDVDVLDGARAPFEKQLELDIYTEVAAPVAGALHLRDVPVCAEADKRCFATRFLTKGKVTISNPYRLTQEVAASVAHDPMGF